MNIERLKAEFARNKTKTAVLGGLLVVLGVFGVKAMMDGGPQSASANAVMQETPRVDAGRAGEMDLKVQQATELWGIMRTKRGIAPASAFRFEGEKFGFKRLYTPPVAQEVKPAEPVPVAVNNEPSAEQREQARQDAIVGEAKQLILQAVVKGDDPTVLINSRRLGVGGEIKGFRIVAVEDRRVRVVKDGVVVEIPLRDAAFPH